MYDDPELDPAAKEKMYPELARANLLRMRGDYKGAVDQCLSILKRMPEDLDAHTLIGDIYSESGDLTQAAQWYELALEVDFKSPTLRSKLESVRERAQHREIAETAEHLGLPTGGSKMTIYGSMAVVMIVCVCIMAYLLGQRHPVENAPLHISVSAPGSLEVSPRSTGPDGGSGTDTGTRNANLINPPLDDRKLTTELMRISDYGQHVISAIQDPASRTITVTYYALASEDINKIGAETARSTLDLHSECPGVKLRGVRDDKLIFAADLTRADLVSALKGLDSTDRSAADSWISDALSNEWNFGDTTDASAGSNTGTTAPAPAGQSGASAPSTPNPSNTTPKDPTGTPATTGTTGT